MSTIATDSVTLLLDTINRDNGLEDNPLTLSEIGLGLPIPIMDNNPFYNTRCSVSGLYGKGYHGTVQVKYQRYELEKMFLGITPTFIIDPSPTRHSDLLPLINSTYGLGLTIDDIIDETFPAGTEDALFTLRVRQTNWAWLGSLRVRFAKVLPFIQDQYNEEELLVVYDGSVLNGKPIASSSLYGYDFSDIAETLYSNNVTNAGLVTNDEFLKIQSMTNIPLSMSPGDEVPDGTISLFGARWYDVVSANGSNLRPGFGYAAIMMIGQDSNYTGSLVLHFNRS